VSLKPLLGGLAAALIAALAGLAVTVQANLPLPVGWVSLYPTTSVVEQGGIHVLKMEMDDPATGTSLEGLQAGSIAANLALEFDLKLDEAVCGPGAVYVYLALGSTTAFGQMLDCPTAEAGSWEHIDLTVDSPNIEWWVGSTKYTWSEFVAAKAGTPLGPVGLVFFQNAASGDETAYFKNIVIVQPVDLGKPIEPPVVVPTTGTSDDDDSGNPGTGNPGNPGSTGSGTTVIVISPPNTGDGGIR
jgi:hypothetical protein